jgi:hypothetical protein
LRNRIAVGNRGLANVQYIKIHIEEDEHKVIAVKSIRRQQRKGRNVNNEIAELM